MFMFVYKREQREREKERRTAATKAYTTARGSKANAYTMLLTMGRVNELH